MINRVVIYFFLILFPTQIVLSQKSNKIHKDFEKIIEYISDSHYWDANSIVSKLDQLEQLSEIDRELLVIFQIIIYNELRNNEKAESLLANLSNDKIKDKLIGTIEYRKQNFSKALKQLIRNEEDLFNTSSIKLNLFLKAYFDKYLGRTYSEIGVYTLAVEKYVEAFEIYNKYNLTSQAAATKKYLGRAFLNLSDKDTVNLKKAEANFLEALKSYKTLKNEEELKWMNVILSDYYIKCQNLKLAEEYYDNGIQLLDIEKDKEIYAILTNNLGEIKLTKEEYIQADKSFKQSITTYKKIGNFSNLCVSYQNLSKLNIKLKRYNKADLYADSAISLSQKTQSKTKEIEGLKIKASINYLQGKLNCYEYYLKAAEIEKEIQQKQNYYLAFSYNIKYETEHVQSINKRLTIENNLKDQRNTNTILVFVIILLFIVLVFSVLYIRWNKKQSEMNNELIDLQHKSLINQLYPHFLFNAITNISGAIFNKKPNEAYNYTVKLTKLIRAYHLDAGKITRTLSEEITFTKNYLDIQKYRFNERFDYNIDIDNKIDTSILIPQMIIHTFVENAVKHGLEPMKKGGLLDIKIIQHKGNIQIIIKDNGIGIKGAKKNKTSGTEKGLKILSKLIRLYNKKEKREINFKLFDLYKHDSAGTLVEITVKN